MLQKELAQPFSTFAIRSEHAENNDSRGEDSRSVQTTTTSVGNLIDKVTAQLHQTEREMAVLWTEWEEAQGQVEEALRDMVPQAFRAGADDAVAPDPVEEMCQAMELELTQATRQIKELSSRAAANMRDVEKVSCP
jgi:hypothetical protein